MGIKRCDLGHFHLVSDTIALSAPKEPPKSDALALPPGQQELSMVAVQQDIAYHKALVEKRRKQKTHSLLILLIVLITIGSEVAGLTIAWLLHHFFGFIWLAVFSCFGTLGLSCIAGQYFERQYDRKTGNLLNEIARLEKLLPPPPLPICSNCTLELTVDSIYCRRCATPVKLAPTTDPPLR